ncbi:MAG: hypothetical protein KAJ86_06415 [Alphaproteobacteria bacterium]|nr:hypothetical protein [Alphaproteobacteria bacterium]
MKKRKTLESRITIRIARKKCAVFLRSDFDDLGGYDQVGRVLRDLVAKDLLMKIGYGLYAKTRKSTLTGQIIPNKPLPQLAKEALKRLGVKTAPSSMERDYNAGRSTQIPTGRMIAVKGRVSRRIGYNGAYVNFEHIT